MPNIKVLVVGGGGSGGNGTPFLGSGKSGGGGDKPFSVFASLNGI